MMKNATKITFNSVLLAVMVFQPILFSVAGCRNAPKAPRTLVVMGFDRTMGAITRHKPDIAFVEQVCARVSESGGVVIVYDIADPCDECGIRCYLDPLPGPDIGQSGQKKAEQRRKINEILTRNKRNRDSFLRAVNIKIFMNSHKISNSDLLGFFKKTTRLLEACEHEKMAKYVFCYSEGIQSVNGVGFPATYDFRHRDDLILCVSGWKMKMPCRMIKQLSEPRDFLNVLRDNG